MWVRSRVRKMPWRREWQPIPIFLPGEVHGQRSMAATVYGVHRARCDCAANTFTIHVCVLHSQMKIKHRLNIPKHRFCDLYNFAKSKSFLLNYPLL